MNVFVIVGIVAVLMLVYMVSALGALPWFIYIPFILLFGMVFFWDRIRALFPGSGTTATGVKSATRRVKNARPKRHGRGRLGGKHSGKRI